MNNSKKLYILPFDHRGSFIGMFGFSESSLTQEQSEKISGYKHVIYESLLKSFSMGVPKECSAILVDEQFGEAIHREAKEAGITRMLTVEKSGQNEFDFEYGDDFAKHIKKIDPDYVKVLVRYNPKGEKQLNQRQIDKLKKANDFCSKEGYKFLFELIALPTKSQLELVGNDQERYDNELRAEVMAEAIQELQNAGIHPDIWKVEGLSNFDQMQKVVLGARSHNKEVGIVVLGRGESEEKVKQWLLVASKIPGIVGFAVGRTVFKKALLDLDQKLISKDEAMGNIASNFKGFVDLFENIS